MRAQKPHTNSEQLGWLNVWRERGDNPLLKYWAISAARYETSRTARATQLGWIIYGGLLSLLCTILILAFTLESQKTGSGPVAQLIRMNSLTASYKLFADCLALGASLWFITGFANAIYTALGFLQSEGKGGARQLFQDLLSSSPLSAGDAIFAFSLQSLRSCTPPLLLLSISTAMLSIPLGGMNSITKLVYEYSGPDALETWGIASRFLLILASSLMLSWVSLLFHVLMSLLLGLSSSGRLMPTIGASVAIAVQFLICGYTEQVVAAGGLGSLGMQDSTFSYMLIMSACSSYSAGALLLLVAASWRSLRSGLAYAYSLVVLLISVACLVLLSSDTDLITGFLDYLNATQSATNWLAVYSPAAALYSAPIELLLLLIAKLGFLVLCYSLAARAIKGRRLGEASL